MKNKVVLITGASSGIGRSLAVEAARQGALLGIMARNTAALEETSAMCKAFGAEVLVVTGDVSREADCKAFVEQAAAHFGRIDVLINNAGISMRALFLELELDVLRRVMDINFWGTVYCTKYALPHLLKSKGTVAGISSIAGYKGLPARTGYSASKFAMQGFLEALRIENLHRGLHVLIACPGFTASNIRHTALSADGSVQGESPRDEDKMMSAETVARHVIHAIQKRRNALVLSGQGKLTVWLNKFFPVLVDKLVFNHMAKEPDTPLKDKS
ncbi:MAG TPA: SDR family oxidoreductase [Bacteroidales bacterium]|nr:SDR family oxidoreductase [Bacteroidales bacterium]